MEVAANVRLDRAVLFGSTLVLMGLLAGCEPQSASMAAPVLGCAAPVPLGCQCIEGMLACAHAPDAMQGGSGGMADVSSGGTAGTSPVAGSGGAAGMVMEMSPAPDAGMAGSGGGAAPDAAVIDPTPLPDPPIPPGTVGYVGEHGALHVEGNRVVDAYNQPIQLRGMSLFWTQWSELYVPKNVDVLVDDWGATVVRAALGVESGGYLSNAQANTDKVRAVVDQAIARGLYVIIDWHDHHAQDHAAQAKAFFEEMARAYGAQPHVIFEVYNEPMDVTWPVVKAYAEDVIQVIRSAGSRNLIIVGTPTWSQDVDIAAASPITSDGNVAYTLHFYANTHKQALRNKASAALAAGIALFVTEWGTCSADGNGAINEGEAQTWLSFLNDNSISWANWALNDKAEACSAIAPGAGSTGPWRDDQLTASGRFVKNAMH